jgi:putative ABC transport system ATP-binding protein
VENPAFVSVIVKNSVILVLERFANRCETSRRKLLESVGITKEQMKRFPSKLSGGEQQRVAIARSLAAGAKTILADEPTGNLDVANTENVMEILGKLAHDEGYLVIVVTHDLEVAQMADVRFEMRDGVMTEKI